MPGAAAQICSITASGTAVPVGLFGEVRKTRSGRTSATAARARSGSMPKSVSLAPLIHRVLVVRAMIGCIE